MADQNNSSDPTQEYENSKAKPGTSKEAVSPFQNLSKNVTSLGSRLRVLEERYTNVRKKIQMTDQNMIDFERDIRDELRTLNQEMMDLKRGVSEINENLNLMSGEVKDAVKRRDFKVVEKYVELWQPMDFVTREELKKTLKDK